MNRLWRVEGDAALFVWVATLFELLTEGLKELSNRLQELGCTETTCGGLPIKAIAKQLGAVAQMRSKLHNG
ncbi:hypothetical protein HMPREF9069_00529 [Atopobium sp. oral taxon 810 str. F0209]|nr:hypothetical protein HMPREF9069_00529 [Atopobium sp. oral taxon 810 str. F0209]